MGELPAEESQEIEETDVIEEEELDQEAEQEPESEEVELYLEEEEEPASKPVPLNKFLKKVNKLNGKVETANTEAEQYRLRAQAAEEEAKLLRMSLKQRTSTPKPEDFDTDDEYEAAKSKYDEQRVSQLARKEAERLFNEDRQAATQAQRDAALQKSLESHYERASSLKVSDYDETEDNAIEILGNDVSKHIMANYGRSQEILYHLGKPQYAAKAAYFRQSIESNPVKGLLELGEYAGKLRTRAKRSQAPDPESRVEGGGGIQKTEGRFIGGAKFT